MIGIIIWFVLGLIGSFLFLFTCHKEFCLDGDTIAIGLFLFFCGPFGFFGMICVSLFEKFSESRFADKLGDFFERMFDKISKRD